MTKSAVVLLSGGLDSTVTAYIARKETGVKGNLYALSFLYGQKHSKELDCATYTASALAVKEHRTISIPLNSLVESSLMADSKLDTPKEEILLEGIPTTWVPQRNSIFLAFAFAYAETVGADKIYTGFNAVDYSGYPDCRPEFVLAIERALNLASKRFVQDGHGIGIVTPIMRLSKADIIKTGLELGVSFGSTWSCYNGRDLACGTCPSCRIRKEAFASLGLEDPITYE